MMHFGKSREGQLNLCICNSVDMRTKEQGKKKKQKQKQRMRELFPKWETTTRVCYLLFVLFQFNIVWVQVKKI